MRLEANAVYRDAACLEVLNHIVNGGALRIDAIGVIVIVTELSIWISRTCCYECVFDIGIADLILKDVAAARAIVVERFIDNIPVPDLALVVAHFSSDMVAHRCQESGARGDAADPTCELAMPDKGMTTDLHIVSLGVGDNRITRSEVESTLSWFGCLPLHLVTGSCARKLAIKDGRVWCGTEEIGGNGSPEDPAFRCCGRAKGRGG